MRSTQIRTYQGKRVVVPNAIVFTNSVRVLTAMPHRRTDLPLIVDYDTQPAKAACDRAEIKIPPLIAVNFYDRNLCP